MTNSQFRTKIKINGKSHYAIRNADGTFKNIESIGKSLADDRRTKAKKVVKPRHGFQGDQRRWENG